MKFYNLLGVLLLMSIAEHALAALPQKLLDLPITLTTGEVVSLADFKGKKPVYLKFWASWCQPCRKEMPHFEQIEQQYGSAIKVISINLGLNEAPGDVGATVKEFGLTMDMAIDKTGDLAQAFRLLGTPYHVLLDRQMNLVHVGNEANESLDNKLALVAEDKLLELLDVAAIAEGEQDLSLNLNDGNVHALFFTATWCDWYLKDSRPKISRQCIAGQESITTLSKNHPNINWQGIASRLWTGEKDLAEYQEKFTPGHAFAIDQNNRLFHQYKVKQLPTLIVVKNGEVLLKSVGKIERNKIEKMLSSL